MELNLQYDPWNQGVCTLPLPAYLTPTSSTELLWYCLEPEPRVLTRALNLRPVRYEPLNLEESKTESQAPFSWSTTWQIKVMVVKELNTHLTKAKPDVHTKKPQTSQLQMARP